MSKYTWRTGETGIVYVTRDGLAESAPTLSAQLSVVMDSVIGRWGALCAKHAARTGSPQSTLLAMIFRESGGNPGIVNRENPPGLGLTQITSPDLYRGYSRTQVLDPDLNVHICSNIVGAYTKAGLDLPATASCYNAGALLNPLRPHPSTVSPWGYRETVGHISAEVAASNYFLMRSALPEVVGQTHAISDEDAVALQFDLRALVDADGHEVPTPDDAA